MLVAPSKAMSTHGFDSHAPEDFRFVEVAQIPVIVIIVLIGVLRHCERSGTASRGSPLSLHAGNIVV